MVEWKVGQSAPRGHQQDLADLSGGFAATLSQTNKNTTHTHTHTHTRTHTRRPNPPAPLFVPPSLFGADDAEFVFNWTSSEINSRQCRTRTLLKKLAAVF